LLNQFVGVPTAGLHPVVSIPISCILILPIMTAPASSRVKTGHSVSVAGRVKNGMLSSTFMPMVVRYPLTCTSSLTPNGTPSSRPFCRPAAHRSADARAAASTASSLTQRQASAYLDGGRTRASSVSATRSGVAAPEA
jgi:hypothetical protein